MIWALLLVYVLLVPLKHSCKWLPSTHSCPPSWLLGNLHFILHNGHLDWHPITTGERTSLIYLSTFYLSSLNLLSGLLIWSLTHPLISDKWTSVNSSSQILSKLTFRGEIKSQFQYSSAHQVFLNLEFPLFYLAPFEQCLLSFPMRSPSVCQSHAAAPGIQVVDREFIPKETYWNSWSPSNI